jgi:hypothetical protein
MKGELCGYTAPHLYFGVFCIVYSVAGAWCLIHFLNPKVEVKGTHFLLFSFIGSCIVHKPHRNIKGREWLGQHILFFQIL